MRGNGTRGLSAAVAFAALLAVACADPATGPINDLNSAAPAITTTSNFGSATGGTIGFGVVRVCKSVPAGDPTETFSFDVQVVGVLASGSGFPGDGTIGSIPGANAIHQLTVAGGATQCVNVFTSTKNGAGLDQVTIVEAAPPTNWTLTAINTVRFIPAAYTPPAGGLGDTENVGTRTAVVFINNDMARQVTFTNDFPNAVSCTFTKGFYRNHPTDVADIIADDFGGALPLGNTTLTAAQAQAVLNATPGKPGNVTFSGKNNFLNLLQQLISATLNGGGSGPSSVQDAIDDANAEITVAGASKNQFSSTLTELEVDALIKTLSGFNEGKNTGFPHCDSLD